MQNDIKLEGVKNYLSWSRRALLILKTKGLEGYVTGEVKEPESTSAEWKTWSTTNSLVVAWLLTSLIPAIATTVETISSASEMWKTLTNLYSGEGNVMLMVEAQEKISALRQGERSVAEYVAELKHLWSDLDHYDPLGLEHPDCIAKMRKWIERRRVIEFLKGLNPEFEGRRDAMFHQTTLPTLDEAIAAMAQDELKRKVLPKATPPSSSPTYAMLQVMEEEEVVIEVEQEVEEVMQVELTEVEAMSIEVITELMWSLLKRVVLDLQMLMLPNLVHSTSGEANREETWDWRQA
ncbi:uncharacterized protein LOC127785166 [Oryza glaberrima]|uniref:uncharacterized protein LOC127785166 n=1 Tax=Oryza glaberrima TaxID=4538 RepID=UPI00224C0D8E|nr:uncharacterized protein LOC127785166 [Oryza glaberrima]